MTGEEVGLESAILLRNRKRSRTWFLYNYKKNINFLKLKLKSLLLKLHNR